MISEPMKPTHAIITCFGRWQYLRLSLKALIDRTDLHVVVVTSSHCPDSTSDKLCGLSEYHARVDWLDIEAPTFSKPEFVNAGVDTLVPDTMLLLMDADTIVSSRVNEIDIGQNEFAFVEAVNGMRDLTGVLVCSASNFCDAGEIDTRMQGWGAEDLDLRLRLHNMGMKHRVLPAGMFSSLSHDDDARVAHYAEKDMAASLQRNLEIMHSNYYTDTGRKLIDDAQLPEISELLGVNTALKKTKLDSE
jgi:hypothetical protein